MTTSTAQQIQAGIDARIDQPILNAAATISLAYATMLGLDGTSLDDAVDQAWTPGGPSKDILRKRIAFRRAHPDQVTQP